MSANCQAYLEDILIARQEYLMARHRAADAQVQIYEALTGISSMSWA